MGLKSLLLFLCILSAVSQTGYALYCNQCANMTDQYCQGTSILCPADNTCASSYIVLYRDGSPVSEVFLMTCAPLEYCSISGSFSIPFDKMKMATSCCHTDHCTPPTPILPPDNIQPNGVTCPTCMSNTSLYCYSEETMRCTGNEMMCLLQASELSEPPKGTYAIRGCASESLCNIDTQHLQLGELKNQNTFSCTSGSVGLHSILLFCITVALSLLKLVQ